jgi:hypothetical protein
MYDRSLQERLALWLLGVTPEDFGLAFRCILPGHAEDNASASLYFDEPTGYLLYHDWHQRSGDEWYCLPEVFASQHYRRAVKLRGPEKATWGIRLAIEVGALQPAAITLKPLPSFATGTARKVYEGFKLLLGCKWLCYPAEPTMFSWRFAAAWCGVGARHAGPAIDCLRQWGIIELIEDRAPGQRRWLFRPTR